MAADKTEMTLFESRGVRGRCLLIYNYLMSIFPASVESERAFSAAAIFYMKICSRLSDCMINILFSPLIFPGRAGTALIIGTFFDLKF